MEVQVVYEFRLGHTRVHTVLGKQIHAGRTTQRNVRIERRLLGPAGQQGDKRA